MRKIIMISCFAMTMQVCRGQTNVFPSDGNAGIGTTTPSAKLAFGIGDIYGEIGRIGFDVAGYQRAYIYANRHTAAGQLTDLALGTMGADRMVIRYDGSVGIGTATPRSRFHVSGGGRNGLVVDGAIDGTSTSKYLSLWQGSGAIGIDPIGTGVIYLGYDAPSDIFFGGSTANGIWKSTGNVGIGTLTPQEKLSVNGNIRSKEVKVEAANWPDYVFKSSYKLIPLSQVENFIKQNGHLPEVPSAKEVGEKGVEVGANQALLLKKIEELTLHLIEKDKELREQRKINKDFEVRLKTLEAKLH
ncbi:MAG: hypothetical protein J7539_16070 [Niabella sp.]|nr:hypothetical protein [Niabella sp.]